MQQAQDIEELYDRAMPDTALWEQFFETLLGFAAGGTNAGLKKLADKAGNPDGEESLPALSIAFREITNGFVQHTAGNFELSNKSTIRAAEIFGASGFEEGLAICAMAFGVNYRTLGAVPLALKYQIECHAALKQTGKYPVYFVACCHQLGELYMDMGNCSEAIQLMEEALDVAARINSLPFRCRLTIALGDAHLRLGNYDQAKKRLDEALSMSRMLNIPGITARIYTDIGAYYAATGLYLKAIEFNTDALAIRNQTGARAAAITNLVTLSQLYRKESNLEKAEELLNEAGMVADELKLKAKQFQVHYALSELYEQKDPLKSLQHYKLYHELKEGVSHDDNERKLKNARAIVEAEQTRKENKIILAQKKEIETKNTLLQETIDNLNTAQELLIREKQRSDELLLNILPEEVAEELKDKGTAAARHFDNVTVLFTDFKGFTGMAERLTPQQLVDELHECFKAFDEIADKYGIEKIKTVGDAWLAASGLPVACAAHAENAVMAAMEIRDFMAERKKDHGDSTFEVRIGMHTGSVVAGIVGARKFAYDIWGDTVNIAARMEQNSEPGKINISESTHKLVQDKFACTCRGEIDAKNKGKLKMYFVEGATQPGC